MTEVSQENKVERNSEISFKVKKRTLLVFAPIIGLAIVILALILSGQGARWWKTYNEASLLVTIRQNDSQELLSEANLIINSQKGVSNKDGQVKLDHLQAGDHQLKVEKIGFITYKTNATLLRGKNKLPDIYLDREPQKEISFNGIIKNRITDQAIPSALVSIADKEVLTNDKGEFNFRLLTGKHDLAISKEGYNSLAQAIEVSSELQKLDYLLAPTKTVYFISNRDGKPGIYSSDLEGKNQTRIVPKSQGSEDNLIIAPNYQVAIFTSTRDGQKNNSGVKVNLPYILDFKTNKFEKISDDPNPTNIIWRPDSKFVLFTSTDLSNDKWTTKINIYDLSKKEVKTLWQGQGSGTSYFIDHEQIFLSVHDNSNSANVNGTVTMNLDGTNLKQVLLDISYNLRRDQINNLLYFQISRNNLKYQFDANTEELKEIKEIPTDLEIYSLSPNGRQMVFVDTRDGKTDLYLKNAKDLEEKRLTTSGTASEPTWLTEDMILYVESKVGETALYIISNLGSKGQKIVDITRSGSSYYEGGEF